jgi:hypothetical protein
MLINTYVSENRGNFKTLLSKVKGGWCPPRPLAETLYTFFISLLLLPLSSHLLMKHTNTIG